MQKAAAIGGFYSIQWSGLFHFSTLRATKVWLLKRPRYGTRVRHAGLSIVAVQSDMPGLYQLRNTGDSHIDMGDFVPGGEVHDTCYGKSEDGLEFPHRPLCRFSIDSIGHDRRDGSI